MSISYNKLWKLLIDKKMSAAELRKAAEIAPNTMTRMRKDQEVTLLVLEKICETLDVDFGDIVEYKKSDDNDRDMEVEHNAEG
ncbi:MAG: helix-turn-helix transcriptional regulator [Clostridiales bacterium]|nr:helix-turn-helix transcriptional regulator [Clostridiales bacterium]